MKVKHLIELLSEQDPEHHVMIAVLTGNPYMDFMIDLSSHNISPMRYKTDDILLIKTATDEDIEHLI